MPYTYDGDNLVWQPDPVPQETGWRGAARSQLGGQADYVIQQLTNLNPNYDWSGAIQQAANLLTGAYPDMGWQDPGRGTPSGVTAAVLNASTGDPKSPVNSNPTVYPQYLAKQKNEEVQIQAEQATHGDEGFLGLGDLGTMLAIAGSVYGLGGLGGLWDGLGALGAGGGELAAGVGGIDAGSLSQILGNGAYGTGGAFAPGMVDVMGGTESAMTNTAGQVNSGIAGSGSSAGAWEGTDTLANPNNLGWEGDYTTPSTTQSGFGSTPVETQAGFNPNNIGGTPSFGESLGSALRNPGGLGGAGTGLLSQLGTGVLGTAANVGSALLGDSDGKGSYQFPWGNVIGSVIGAVGANNASDTYADALRYAVDKADPFSAERPYYQGQLKQMYTDPNYFSTSPVMKGLVDTSLDQAQRKLASQGYNYSGNTPSELAKLATNESFKYAQSQQDMTAKAAGAYTGPGAAGTIAGQGAQTQVGLNNQLYGNLGAGFQSVINGAQPTAAQQVNGAQPNQSLADVFKGWGI